MRMAPLLVVPALLREMGVDTNPLIADAGLDPALFAHPDNTIAFTDQREHRPITVALAPRAVSHNILSGIKPGASR